MTLSPAVCYRAVEAKDRRFDGAFFVGVTTTGIFCRPVCTAKTPREDRCVFFRLPIEAEKAGFRACLRCRPELAPGAASVDARTVLSLRAVHRIEAGALNDGSVDDLAAELGVSARHIRRVLRAELGVGPIELAQSLRLSLAKQLLQDSRLTITDVAFASGFASVRRFNTSFLERFRRRPTDIRSRNASPDARDRGSFTMSLGYRDRFAWSSFLAFLGTRATRGVEYVNDGVYARSLRVGSRVGFVAVRDKPHHRLIEVEISSSLSAAAMNIADRVRRAFDLHAAPHRIRAHLRHDPSLREMLGEAPRLAGTFDPFEVSVRAVLGQQVSVASATTLAGRLAHAFGDHVVTPFEPITRLTPTADRLAGASVREIAAIGLPAARAATLSKLARAFVDRRIVLEAGMNAEEATAALLAIPGIGPWTASYVTMRALGLPDAFPAGDLGLRRALGGITARDLALRAEAWRPWRSYAAFAIWAHARRR